MTLDAQPLLATLGRRIRARREAAGLGVQEAARAAGLSRRTWTEVEAGRANPSLSVLLAIAEAVDAPLAELVLDLRRARPRERVALVGLRGAGKSTVGPLIARALEVAFVELDARVEELAGMPLSEVFALHGAQTFHRLEAEALEAVLAEGERVVLAAGGSIVDAPATFRRLRATCRTVWLRASPQAHFRRVLDQGDRRPMANRPAAMEELIQLLARREGAYGACDVAVQTDGHEPAEVAREALDRLAALQST